MISKKKIIFLILVFSINFIFAREVLQDDCGFLSNSSFKKISKLIKETSKETGVSHTIVISKDDKTIYDAQQLCDAMLDEMSYYERGFNGTLLLILIGDDEKVSNICMSFLGRKTKKVLNERRIDNILDLSLDCGLKHGDFNRGIRIYLELLEVLFEDER